MEQHLLPVWGDSRFVGAARDVGLKPGEWWDKPPMEYGHCLISYVHWKKPFTFPKDAHIFGDSGGFTLRNGGKPIRIDPLDVLRWQESMCTVGCVLDKPPGFGTTITVGKNAGTYTFPRMWEQGLQVTLDHMKRALPEYLAMRERGSKFRWWGVLHGNNEREVMEYHAALSRIYPFTDEGEGWAIRPEPMVDIYSVARSLRILQHLDIKRVHFLAATSQNVIAVLLTLGVMAGLKFMTYDSAYAIKSGFNRHIFKPSEDGLTFAIDTETGLERHGRDFMMHECPCAVCIHMRVRSLEVPKAVNELHQPKFAGWWSLWFQMHDLYIQERATNAQAELAHKSPESLLRRLLDPKEYSMVMRIFEEDGHEARSIVPTGTSRGLLDYIK